MVDGLLDSEARISRKRRYKQITEVPARLTRAWPLTFARFREGLRDLFGGFAGSITSFAHPFAYAYDPAYKALGRPDRGIALAARTKPARGMNRKTGVT